MFFHTKSSVKQDEYIVYKRLLKDAAITTTRVCPICGESDTLLHHQCNHMTPEMPLKILGIERHISTIFKLFPIIGNEHRYSIIKCRCHTCGYKWNSKPFIQ